MADQLRLTMARKATGIAQDTARQALKELIKDAVREVDEETTATGGSRSGRTRSGLLLIGVGVVLGYLLGETEFDANELADEAGRIEESLSDVDDLGDLDDAVSVDVSEEAVEPDAVETDGADGGRLEAALAVIAVAGLAATGYVALTGGDEDGGDDIGRHGSVGSGGAGKSDVDAGFETGVDAGTGVDDVGVDTEVEGVEGAAPGGVDENEAADESPDEGGNGAAESDDAAETGDERRTERSDDE